MSRLAAAAILLAVGAAGCGTAGSISGVTTTVTTGTLSAVAVGNLTVALTRPPSHSFIVPGGHWRICDTGTVTNPGPVAAAGVRVVVTYLDHGVPVGGVTLGDAAQAGGALGDIPPGQSRPFTVCGLAAREPDSDRIAAVPGR